MKSTTTEMKIDIDSIPEGENASTQLPILRNLKSWKQIELEIVPRWNLHRYLVILYCHDSFLNRKNPLPLTDRKEAALNFAKIERNEDVENHLLNLNDDLVVLLIRDLLIAQNHHLWTEIVTLEQQISEAIRIRLRSNNKSEPSNAVLKRGLTEDCKQWQGDLTTNYRKFYKDHTDVKEKVRDRATTLEMIAIPTTENV